MSPDRRRHLRPNPHTLGVLTLTDDEVSEIVRVRGPADAVLWFKGLTATERGALVVSMRPPSP